MNRARAALPFVVAAVLLGLSAPPWPDDWDGLGFVASMDRFDMDGFAPHPPGYPVYVALLRVAHALLHPPMVAASAVAVVSGLAASLLLERAVRRLLPAAALPLGLAALVTPLAWRSASAVGSEAPALAFAAAGAWGLVAARTEKAARSAWIVGAAVGIGMGVRLSWAPLYVPMLLLLPRGLRTRASLVAALCVAAWTLPLALLVGPAHLVALFRIHFAGHAARWGGTMLTEPGAGRLAWLLRDVFADGLGGGTDPLGLAILCSAALLGVLGLEAWRRRKWSGARYGALLLLPYLAWITVGQNLHQQPRHVLPLVVAVALGLAWAATTSRHAAWAGAVLGSLVMLRTSLDAYARRTIPPPGAQIVAFARALPQPADAAFFGGPSARFLERTELAGHAATCGSLGDAMVALGRMNDLPSRAFVTGELEDLQDARPPLVQVGVFCRPERLDRRAPCVTLYAWKLSVLRGSGAPDDPGRRAPTPPPSPTPR